MIYCVLCVGYISGLDCYQRGSNCSLLSSYYTVSLPVSLLSPSDSLLKIFSRAFLFCFMQAFLTHICFLSAPISVCYMPTLLSLHLGAAYVLSFKGARLVSVSLKLPHTHKCSLPLSRTSATAIAGGLPLTPALYVCEATVCMTHSLTL